LGRPGDLTADEKGATMSNHFSAAMLKFPGDDSRLDFTNLFRVRVAGEPGKDGADLRRESVHDGR
jgi:hypothetical protein